MTVPAAPRSLRPSGMYTFSLMVMLKLTLLEGPSILAYCGFHPGDGLLRYTLNPQSLQVVVS